MIQTGNIIIDEAGYSAKLNGAQLDLTYTEFELLKYLAQHPGRVFSRQQLLSDVSGYDYFGGTRTVDVHVRRLRAKLGPSTSRSSAPSATSATASWPNRGQQSLIRRVGCCFEVSPTGSRADGWRNEERNTLSFREE